MDRARKRKKWYSSFVENKEYIQANRRTPDGVIVAAAFAMVLVSVTWVEIFKLLALCACLACSANCFVLSPDVDK